MCFQNVKTTERQYQVITGFLTSDQMVRVQCKHIFNNLSVTEIMILERKHKKKFKYNARDKISSDQVYFIKSSEKACIYPETTELQKYTGYFPILPIFCPLISIM